MQAGKHITQTIAIVGYNKIYNKFH